MARRQHQILDQILMVLAEQKVPYHFKEIARVAPEITVFGFQLGFRQLTFEVHVLRSDVEYAGRAIQNIRRM